jgi:hypothetical protein
MENSLWVKGNSSDYGGTLGEEFSVEWRQMETVRWSLKISKEADASLRSYLAQHGLADHDLSRFVEEAVRWRILDRAVAETSAANAGVPAEEIEAAIDEALQAVRAERFRE